MKKFNLFNEIIKVDRVEFEKAVKSDKVFAITTDAKIIYEDFNTALIYKGKGKPEKNYQVVDDNDVVLIKAFSNWQELITINTPLASYDDTTADGVAEFSNSELEDIGWHATEFDVDYRTLVELLEEKCDGTILCIEQADPYQFSGLGFLGDNKQAKKVMFEYCQTKAKDMMKNDHDFKKENLTDDELEAAQFFKVVP
ncbi:MAG: hypothetical protein U9O83_02705 [Campylobacterota bacterium]|nr:hypothetical protein [Campylobacterota bacterium]